MADKRRRKLQLQEQRRLDYQKATEVAGQEEEYEDEAGFIKVDDDDDEEAVVDKEGADATASDGVTITASPDKVEKEI